MANVFVRVLHGGYQPGNKFTAGKLDPVQIADDPTKLARGGVWYEATEVLSEEHPDARRFEIVNEVAQ